MKKTLLTICLVVAGLFAAEAQNKLGYINSDEMISLMPEYIAAVDEVKSYENGIMASLKAMVAEFEQKQFQLEQNIETMSEFDQEIKMKELQGMYQRIQDSENDAQQKVVKKSEELLMPIQQKAINTINEVAKEGGFTYIFDSRQGILYAAESENILPLVKAKLGL